MYVPAVSVKSPVPLYGAVPPVAETVTVEVPPLQSMVVDELEADNAVGSVMVIVVAVSYTHLTLPTSDLV